MCAYARWIYKLLILFVAMLYTRIKGHSVTNEYNLVNAPHIALFVNFPHKNVQSIISLFKHFVNHNCFMFVYIIYTIKMCSSFLNIRLNRGLK